MGLNITFQHYAVASMFKWRPFSSVYVVLYWDKQMLLIFSWKRGLLVLRFILGLHFILPLQQMFPPLKIKQTSVRNVLICFLTCCSRAPACSILWPFCLLKTCFAGISLTFKSVNKLGRFSKKNHLSKKGEAATLISHSFFLTRVKKKKSCKYIHH